MVKHLQFEILILKLRCNAGWFAPRYARSRPTCCWSLKELNLCFNIMNVKLCLLNQEKLQKWAFWVWFGCKIGLIVADSPIIKHNRGWFWVNRSNYACSRPVACDCSVCINKSICWGQISFHQAFLAQMLDFVSERNIDLLGANLFSSWI